MAQKLIHICEVCGKTVIMTPEQAFNEGWITRLRWEALGLYLREHVGIVT